MYHTNFWKMVSWITEFSDSNPYSGVELQPWTFQWDLALHLLIWTVLHINRSLHHWIIEGNVQLGLHHFASYLRIYGMYIVGHFTLAPSAHAPLLPFHSFQLTCYSIFFQLTFCTPLLILSIITLFQCITASIPQTCHCSTVLALYVIWAIAA